MHGSDKLLACAQVELYACFRPGDLVRAEVIGLGDARSYYLSTAKNDLGVVYAKSAAGVQPHASAAVVGVRVMSAHYLMWWEAPACAC